VDGPDGKHFFGVSNDLVGCGHMSGLLVRSRCPLALMKSDDRDPYQVRELCAHDFWRVVPGLRWRPCRSSRLFALAKLELEPAKLFFECSLR
jgi:hypothetical protein